MKKYLIMACALSLFAAGCTRMADDVFDKSAAERVAESAAHAQKILTESPNGWIVQYYPQRDLRSYGGFNLYFKFGADGTVLVGADIAEDFTDSSLYTIGTDYGPSVNFDLYNEVFHYFSDPGLDVGEGEGFGYEGDYEFGVVSATPEEVILRGKKTHNIARLIPLPEGTAWTQYLGQVNAIAEASAAPKYKCDFGIEGRELSAATSGRVLTFTLKAPAAEPGGEETTEVFTTPFIYTPTGILFYEPLTIAGHTVREFTFDAATETFTAVGGTEKMKLAFDINTVLVETDTQWVFVDMSASMGALFDAAAASVMVSDGEEIDVSFLGRSIDESYTGLELGFICGGRYHACYAFTFKAVAGSADRLAMTYDRAIGFGAYQAYLNAFTPIVNAIVAGSPYVLVGNDERNPTAITLTSAADPSVWFTVAL